MRIIMAQDTPSRKLDQYIVRFPDGMRDQLKQAAKENNRSLNAEIISRLQSTMTSTSLLDFSDILDQISGNISKLRKGVSNIFYSDEFSDAETLDKYVFIIFYILAEIEKSQVGAIMYDPLVLLRNFTNYDTNRNEFNEIYENCLEYMHERRFVIYEEIEGKAIIQLGFEGAEFLSKIWTKKPLFKTVSETLKRWLPSIENKDLDFSLDGLENSFIIFAKKEIIGKT